MDRKVAGGVWVRRRLDPVLWGLLGRAILARPCRRLLSWMVVVRLSACLFEAIGEVRAARRATRGLRAAVCVGALCQSLPCRRPSCFPRRSPPTWPSNHLPPVTTCHLQLTCQVAASNKYYTNNNNPPGGGDLAAWLVERERERERESLLILLLGWHPTVSTR